MKGRKAFSPEFKCEAASLVVDRGYSIAQACEATGVGKGIASLMRWWCKSPKPGQSKTWGLFGKTSHGKLCGETRYRLVGQGKKLFR